MNLFVRLRISKQDKIAANVAQHIRAVRAAEALDRRTRLRRTDSFNFSGIGSTILPVQRSTSSGEESPGGHDKKRLVGMLKQAYVGEVHPTSTAEDVACQTSYDLLEALLPSLRKRILRSTETVASVDDDACKSDSCHHRHPLFGDSYRHYSNHHHDGSSPMRRSQQGSRPSSKTKNRTTQRSDPLTTDRIEVEYKLPDCDFHDYETEEVLSLKEMKRSKALQLLGKNKSQYNKLQAVSTTTDATSLNLTSENSFSPTVSQDSLIEAGSSIIEESASTGSDDTPGSAVYKNIIINLGGGHPHQSRSLFNSSQSSAGNLNIMPTINDSRTSRSQESVDDICGAKKASPDFANWHSPNGSARCLAKKSEKGDS